MDEEDLLIGIKVLVWVGRINTQGATCQKYAYKYRTNYFLYLGPDHVSASTGIPMSLAHCGRSSIICFKTFALSTRGSASQIISSWTVRTTGNPFFSHLNMAATNKSLASPEAKFSVRRPPKASTVFQCLFFLPLKVQDRRTSGASGVDHGIVFRIGWGLK